VGSGQSFSTDGTDSVVDLRLLVLFWRGTGSTSAEASEAYSGSQKCEAMPPRRITVYLGDRIIARQNARMRTTPARLASALRLAKQSLEETNRHRWTHDDQDCYISTLFGHIKRDNRWTCVEDNAVYICAMFRKCYTSTMNVRIYNFREVQFPL
jgi:hypothetical protein